MNYIQYVVGHVVTSWSAAACVAELNRDSFRSSRRRPCVPLSRSFDHPHHTGPPARRCRRHRRPSSTIHGTISARELFNIMTLMQVWDGDMNWVGCGVWCCSFWRFLC